MKTIYMNHKCKLCNQEFKSRLMSHVHKKHNLTTKQYYDLFYKKPNDGICVVCGNDTTFYRTSYNICCSQTCAAIYRWINSNHNKDIEQFELENDCTNIVKLRELYGQGWYKAKVIDSYIEHSFQTKMYFVKNEDIDKIIQYNSTHKYSGKSHLEKTIVKVLKEHNVNIIENDKTLIYPKELDIYLPDYKTAIEFNGTWYHSIEAGCDKNYHLEKSILCRNKDIRLIHIYEFENIDEQIELLLSYINNDDKYNQNDFNKNNLVNDVPSSELIYVSPRGYHIYGAGKLERS